MVSADLSHHWGDSRLLIRSPSNDKNAQMGVLVAQLNGSNADAIAAIEELAQKGWLYNGTLQDISLSYANLHSARIGEADFSGADMTGATLVVVDAESVQLARATLTIANLTDSYFAGANFRAANLAGADLEKVDLRGADLREANLDRTFLGGANFDDTTILPDGEFWSPETDLTRFTDPDHPGFWCSNDPDSPAYHG